MPQTTEPVANDTKNVPADPGYQILSRNVEILSTDLAPSEPPRAVRLFGAGINETTKGEFNFSAKSASAVIAAAQDYGNDLNFDYNHAMLGFLQMDPAEANKAAGWFQLEVRNGELWAANIRWTPKARDMILSREYRYISPAFTTDDDGEIAELINCALTNMPATKRMRPLIASREKKMADDVKPVDPVKPEDFSGVIALTGKASAAEAMAVIQAWKNGAEKAVELSKQLAAVEAAKTEAEKESLIKQGQGDGKIPPAMVDWAKSQTVDSLKAYLSVAVPFVAPKGATPPAPAAPAKGELTAEERKIAKLCGLDLKKVAAHKAVREPSDDSAFDSEE